MTIPHLFKLVGGFCSTHLKKHAQVVKLEMISPNIRGKHPKMFETTSQYRLGCPGFPHPGGEYQMKVLVVGIPG